MTRRARKLRPLFVGLMGGLEAAFCLEANECSLDIFS